MKKWIDEMMMNEMRRHVCGHDLHRRLIGPSSSRSTRLDRKCRIKSAGAESVRVTRDEERAKGLIIM